MKLAVKERTWAILRTKTAAACAARKAKHLSEKFVSMLLPEWDGSHEFASLLFLTGD